MEYEYIGWVPCVGGRLFFEYTCCSLGDEVVPSVNHASPTSDPAIYKRNVIVCSLVDWKDSTDPATSGKFHVLLLAQKLSSEISLSGRAYLIPEDALGAEWDTIQNNLSGIIRRVQKEEDIASDVESLQNRLNENANPCIYPVDFVVESRGFVKLRYVQRSSVPVSFEHKFTICRQAYYFIKYSLHRHQHHHDKAESLTSIHSLSIDKEQLGIKMLNEIRKSLVQIKRDSEDYDSDNLFRARGIVSYAKSLAESCHRDGYLDKDEYESEKAYFDNIKSSIEVIADGVTKQIAKSTAISGNARALILFGLAMLAPLLAIYRDRIKELAGNDGPYFFLKAVATVTSSDTGLLSLALVLVGFFTIYRLITNRFGRFLLAFSWYRRFMTIIVQDGRKGLIVAVMLLCISCVLILYFILHNLW